MLVRYGDTQDLHVVTHPFPTRRSADLLLRRVAVELGLAHVEVVEAPLERIETCPAATISARALAPLDKLLDLSARFSTESTIWLLPKGRNAVKELALLPQPWQRMFHVEQSRSEEHTSELQSLMRNSYAVFCLKTKKTQQQTNPNSH